MVHRGYSVRELHRSVQGIEECNCTGKSCVRSRSIINGEKGGERKQQIRVRDGSNVRSRRIGGTEEKFQVGHEPGILSSSILVFSMLASFGSSRFASSIPAMVNCIPMYLVFCCGGVPGIVRLRATKNMPYPYQGVESRKTHAL